MRSQALLVYSSSELKTIAQLEPDFVSKYDIFFLTADIDYAIIQELNVHEYFLFDNDISLSELQDMHTKAIALTDSWFLERNGNDVTMIENFSIGRCFHAFLSHTFCHAMKYERFLKKIDNKYDIITITETPNSLLEIFLSENPFLLKKINKLPVTDSNAISPSAVINLKVTGFNIFFKEKFSLISFVKKLFIRIWMMTEIFSCKKNKIFFIPAGKTQLLIKHYIKQSSPRKFNFIFPFNSESFSWNLSNLYHDISTGPFPSKTLSTNLMKKIRQLPSREQLSSPIIVKIIEKYLEPHFDGVFSYYKSAFSQLKRSLPELVILSAESHETNIIIAQAAKNLKLKTCTIPHGITFPLLSDVYYRGKEAIYKSAFLFSESNKEANLKKGFEASQLYVSSFHYFSKFLPVKPLLNKSSRVRKVLILPPDFSDFCRSLYVTEATQKIIETCLLLGINDIAIKARVEAQLKSMFIKANKIIFNQKEIPIYSGYTAFPQYAKEVDIVVGPPSSATIESILMGIPYFCYQEAEAFIGGWEYSNIETVLYIAKTADELRENILQNRIFRQGKTIDDLVLISQLKDENDFIKIFESALQQCIENKEKFR